MLFPAWFCPYRGKFSCKEAWFKTFYLPLKPICLPAENINDTPDNNLLFITYLP